MPRVRLEIPERYFVASMLILQDLKLLNHDVIGKVHLPGSWNNWGDSPEKAGCIRPKPETQMHQEDSNFIIDIDIPSGIHTCKPVVVMTEPDDNGMCRSEWIECTEKGQGEFTREGHHANWRFVVR